jgi:hypothetical protein
MSPSESQLRAALHEGEGDALDAGLLIAHAHRARRERRQRVNRLAGATLVVGLLGGGLMLLGRGSNEEGGGSSAGGTALGRARSLNAAPHAATAPASAASSSADGAGGGGGLAGSPPAGSFAATCPPVPDRIEIPTSYAPNDAYRGALFPPGTSAIRACAYPGGALHRTVVLQAGMARAVASTVNAAAKRPTPSKRTCTENEPAGTLELLPVTDTGKRAKPVVVTVACPNAIATNGVAARYFVVAPRLLSNLLR